jgi:hypothetical protein
MNILRTYFTKDNVILKNSFLNTGKNPIIELFYGGSAINNKTFYSRYLFDLDINGLKEKYQNGDIIIDENTKHIIKIKNTSCFMESKFCRTFCSFKGEVGRATSFDLILFKVPEEWDEGNGYDYGKINYVGSNNDYTYCEGASNWYDRKTSLNWLETGVYSGNPTNYNNGENLVLLEQHFDGGDEDICMDVTNYINDVITGDTPFYGFGIAYDYPLETSSLSDLKYTGFFGKETNTVYEPYLETNYGYVIKDDRKNFFVNKTNSLYLYSFMGGIPKDIDSLSGVSIQNSNGTEVLYINSDDVKKISKGVYKVDVSLSSTGNCINQEFQDVWKDVVIDGVYLGDITMSFIVKSRNEFFSLGNTSNVNPINYSDDTNISIYDYSLSTNGLYKKEKIKRGDTKKVYVNLRPPYTYDNINIIDNIYYRIFIKEGNTQIDYLDWKEVNRAYDSNYFIIDTSWFIPNDYYLEIKIISGNEVRTFNNIIDFEVVSEKKLC